MKLNNVVVASALALITLAGCSAAPESDEDLLNAAADISETEGALPAMPDLFFDGGYIVLNDGFTSQVVKTKGTANVNCQTKKIGITYREKNGGALGAIGHKVRLNVAGNPWVDVPVLGLASGAIRVAPIGMSPIVLPANVSVLAGLMTDSLFVVAEASETNNALPFLIVRKCL